MSAKSRISGFARDVRKSVGSARNDFEDATKRTVQRLTPGARRFRQATGEGIDVIVDTTRRGIQNFATPPRLEPVIERASLLGQIMAAALLIVIVPITFTLIRIAQRLLIRVVLDIGPFDTSESAPWVVTLVTFGMLIGASWFWFLLVRTAGFGMFNFGEQT